MPSMRGAERNRSYATASRYADSMCSWRKIFATTCPDWSSVPRHASRQPSYATCSRSTSRCRGSGSTGGSGSVPRAGHLSGTGGIMGEESGTGIVGGRMEVPSSCRIRRARRRTRVAEEIPAASYEKASTCSHSEAASRRLVVVSDARALWTHNCLVQ